jgi:Acetoacetate decarboxylase (ADC)
MTMVDLGGRIRDRGVPVAPVQRQVSRLDFVGDLDAAIALLAVPADTASAMLPDGLRLARRSATPENQHPLLLMLGRQRNVRLALFSSGIDYLEFILAVPFVEHDRPGRPRGPFGYLPCLLLDRRLPIVAGRVLLAYAKRRAAISATDETYRIACARTGEPLVSARFEATGGSSKGRLSGPIVEVLQLPVISRSARGAWRYSVADLTLGRAQIEPIGIELAIERPFVPGLPAGSFALDAKAGHAFRLRTSWRLTGPFARRSPPLASGAGQSPAEAVT